MDGLCALTHAQATEIGRSGGRFVRTLKEQLLWARTFETIEDLRVALIDFMRRYNESWLVLKHNYLTPDQVRNKLTQPAALAA